MLDMVFREEHATAKIVKFIKIYMPRCKLREYLCAELTYN